MAANSLGDPRFFFFWDVPVELEARRVRQEAQLMRRQCVQETVNGPTVVGCFRPVTIDYCYYISLLVQLLSLLLLLLFLSFLLLLLLLLLLFIIMIIIISIIITYDFII